jgi:hypothetical protein
VTILEIDLEDVASVAVFKAKGQPPIAADRHGEGPASIASEDMKPARPAQVVGAGGAVDRVQDQGHAFVKFRPNPARAPNTKDFFHTFVEKVLIGIRILLT